MACDLCPSQQLRGERETAFAGACQEPRVPLRPGLRLLGEALHDLFCVCLPGAGPGRRGGSRDHLETEPAGQGAAVFSLHRPLLASTRRAESVCAPLPDRARLLYLKHRLGATGFRQRNLEGIERYLTLCFVALAYLQWRLPQTPEAQTLADVMREHRDTHQLHFLMRVCETALQLRAVK